MHIFLNKLQMVRTNTETTQQSSSSTLPKRKRKAATNAIREIRAEQKNTSLIIPLAPMNRLVAELAQNYKVDLRFKGEAYRALHTAAENYLIETFQRANKCAIHDFRETVQPKDFQLAKDLAASQ
jgi:histone H3/H4